MNNQLSQKQKPEKIKKLFLVIIGIVILIVIIGIISGSDKKNKEKQTEGEADLSTQQQEIPLFKQQEQEIKVQPRQYTIVETEDISIKALDKSLSSYSQEELAQLPLNIRMEYRIIIPSDIKKDELRATLIQVVKDNTQTDEDIDEVVVFAYDNKQDIDGFYTFGKVEWSPGGNWAGVTSIIALTNNRSSYEYVFDIKEKVGEEDNPTAKEIEIYNVYWEKLNETGNPRGYINHPTNLSSSNEWEKTKMQQVISIYNISYDELFNIVIKVSFWKLK